MSRAFRNSELLKGASKWFLGKPRYRVFVLLDEYWLIQHVLKPILKVNDKCL